jgi:hypothetical protein
MTTANTRTQTYTVADIRKVVESFAAVYSMIAQSSKLHTRDFVARTVSDLQQFATDGYLVEVLIMLKDSAGNKLNAVTFRPSTNANGWTSDRPSSDLWPETPGGSLYVLATVNNAWSSKTDQQKLDYISANGLNFPWGSNTEDLSTAGMNSTAGQRFASNGYGWLSTNFSK